MSDLHDDGPPGPPDETRVDPQPTTRSPARPQSAPEPARAVNRTLLDDAPRIPSEHRGGVAPEHPTELDNHGMTGAGAEAWQRLAPDDPTAIPRNPHAPA